MVDDRHLSQIVTSWSVVRGASDPEHPDRQAAIGQLLELYSPSIRRYLMAAVKDQSAADEIYQNFALKLVRGDFAGADPARGRFRSFVKTVLFRLVIDFHRSNKRQATGGDLAVEPVDNQSDVDERMDIQLRQHWREGLLTHAWNALEEEQNQRGGIYYSLLRTRSDNPEFSHDQLIDEIEKQTGQRPNSGSLRVTLHRARQRFADHLVDAVTASLGDPSDEHLEDELIVLDLQKYCGEALARRKDKEAKT